MLQSGYSALGRCFLCYSVPMSKEGKLVLDVGGFTYYTKGRSREKKILKVRVLKMNLKQGLAACFVIAGLVAAGSSTAEANEHQIANTESIVDFLYLQGEDHSFNNRAELAANEGIEGYQGTATQNLTLLSVLRDGTKVETQEDQPVATQQTTTTNEEPAPTQASGVTMQMEATAYTAYCTGCSGVTYTGQDLRANPNQKVVAVDPNVIPLGSRVYVEGYGEALAGDIGGAIKGNKIDLFIPDRSAALSFGRQTVNVTVLD